jgi:hypothetical protein
MIVYKITTEDYNKIKGQAYAPDMHFNPIMDINGNWVISIEELNGIVFPEFLYLSEQQCEEVDGEQVCHYVNVTPIEYQPVPAPPFPTK